MTERVPKPWLSGEPYYCALCGCGMAEYMACEEPDCELESKEVAQQRAAKAASSAATVTASTGEKL